MAQFTHSLCEEVIRTNGKCGLTHNEMVQLANLALRVLKPADAVPAEAAQHHWQPIETAPRDGTVILLRQSFNALCCYASDTRPLKEIAIGYFKDWWVTGTPGGHSSGGGDNNFTHWMPLPSIPSPRGTT